jgi:hypothetical protein
MNIYDFFASLPGGYNTIAVGDGTGQSTVLFWASEPGTKIGVSGTVNSGGGASFTFSTEAVYKPE